MSDDILPDSLDKKELSMLVKHGEYNEKTIYERLTSVDKDDFPHWASAVAKTRLKKAGLQETRGAIEAIIQELKLTRRRVKNRLSAKSSRNEVKRKQDVLQERIVELKDENVVLRQRIGMLRFSKGFLERCVQILLESENKSAGKAMIQNEISALCNETQLRFKRQKVQPCDTNEALIRSIEEATSSMLQVEADPPPQQQQQQQDLMITLPPLWDNDELLGDLGDSLWESPLQMHLVTPEMQPALESMSKCLEKERRIEYNKAFWQGNDFGTRALDSTTTEEEEGQYGVPDFPVL